jgi:CTD kinase subunit beta
MFEDRSKIIIGLERLMLESSGFDFRNRYPQRLVLKIAKHYNVEKDTVGKTAYNMSMDLYRTFAPLKQTTITLAMACVELSARVFAQNVRELEAGTDYKKWQTSRPEVMGWYFFHFITVLVLKTYHNLVETLLDLLDLYTHYKSSTVVGQDHSLEHFISIRITLNQEASTNQYPRYTQGPRKQFPNGSKATNGTTKSKSSKDSRSLSSPLDDPSKDLKVPPSTGPINGLTSHGKHGVKDGTVRFMLDPERARDEKLAVAEFFKVEEEEYEVEVEVERERERERRRV